MMDFLSKQSELYDIYQKVEAGRRLDWQDGVRLLHSDDIFTMGKMANMVRERRHGNKAYYVINRHINYSNICILSCRFCAFGKKANQPGAYEMSLDEIFDKARHLEREEASEVHIVGGLHPDLPYEYYVEMIRGLKQRHPDVHFKCFTAVELHYLAELSGKGVCGVLEDLVEAGLGSLTGGGAEMFSERVHAILCGEKISAKEWLEIHRIAHNMGIRSTCTMLYGHVERPHESVEHMLRLRALQDETGGFTAFIPLAFHPDHTSLMRLKPPSGMSCLKHIAVARLLLDNIAHIKVYWIMMGIKVAQIGLSFGADDLDGTVVEEKIYHMAGATTPQALTRRDLCRVIRQTGRVPVLRDSLYHELQVSATA